MNADFVASGDAAPSSDMPVFGSVEETFGPWLASRGYEQAFVLCDANTQALCLPLLRDVKKIGPLLPPHTHVFAIPAGERHKTPDTCVQVWRAMADFGLRRKGLVMLLGGGVVGDLGGFCAATWARGVDYVQIPTTLLAMIDASIGGKTGLDLDGLKNAVGLFGRPQGVFADTDFLRTLPEREWRSGLAEAIKHACLGRPDLLPALRAPLDSIAWPALLPPLVEIKARIVALDPGERDLRRALNFGHTIGHAIETWSLRQNADAPLSHGEAVALGMLLESRIAADLNSDYAPLRDALEGLYTLHYPPVAFPRAALAPIHALMRADKKNTDAGDPLMALPGPTPFSLRMLRISESDWLKVAAPLLEGSV